MLLDVVDNFPQRIAIMKIRFSTAERAVKEPRKLFPEYGIPIHMIRDNETQFTTDEFATFEKKNGT